MSYSSFISAEEDERVLRLVSNPSPACPDLPSFPFETIHISCKSDAYQGTDYCYAGVIIYSCDGKYLSGKPPMAPVVRVDILSLWIPQP